MPNKPGRTSEYEYSIAILRYLASLPSGEASVTSLKAKMPNLLPLTQGDMEPSGSRPGELVYQQIVGNIVSHRHDSPDNFVNRGLLGYRPRYLSVTDAGRRFLEKRKG
jgi:hypothetical protein